VEQWFVELEHASFLGRMRQRQISRFHRHLYHCYCKIKIFHLRKGHGSGHLLLIGFHSIRCRCRFIPVAKAADQYSSNTRVLVLTTSAHCTLATAATTKRILTWLAVFVELLHASFLLTRIQMNPPITVISYPHDIDADITCD
jgi:hypothetical protein